MDFTYIDNSMQKEWEELVNANPASGYKQSFFWSEFVNLLGWTTFKIGILDNAMLIGGAVIEKFPYTKDFNILHIPEGPVLPYGKAELETLFHSFMNEVDKIADLKGNNRTSHIRIEPKLTKLPPYFNRFKKAPINQQPLSTLVVDLSQKEGDILSQMKPKGRYNIKVALKYGVEIIQSGFREGQSDFLNLYRQTLERNNFEGKNADYFERLIYTAHDYGKLFFAKYKNEVLASALVIYFGNTATFLFGASSSIHREMMAPYLLHWEIIKDAKKMGMKWYDFYRVAPDENDLNHPWHGFTVFKKKFGGEQINYIGAYDFVYNEKLYKEYLVRSKEI